MTNKKNKVMIVIERTWKEPDSIGGGRLNKVARKCFADDDLDAELDKYIKDNFTIDKEQLDRFNIEEKDYMYSMDKSDMEKMVRYFTGNYKIPVSDDLEEAAKLYVSDSLCITGEEDWDDAAIEALNAYKAGAQWQKQQFEKNRLEHCDSITEEQYNLEVGFIDSHIDKYNRMPTFLDAIEYGMEKMKEQMMAKAIDATIEEPEPLLWRVLGELEGLFVVENNLHDGDGVKVIIVKED